LISFTLDDFRRAASFLQDSVIRRKSVRIGANAFHGLNDCISMHERKPGLARDPMQPRGSIL
jgi:hypothetical protein